MRFVACALLATLLLAGMTVGLGEPVQSLASLVLLWFLPGFAVQEAALYRADARPGVIERVVISVGVSLALLALVGVLLDAAHFQLRVATVLVAITTVTLSASCTGLVRMTIAHDLRMGQWPRVARLPSSWRVPVLAIGIAVVGSVSVLAWKPPPSGDTFTELAVVDASGMAPILPIVLRANETRSFGVLVTSQEQSAGEYTIRVVGADLIVPQGPTQVALTPGQSTVTVVTASWTGVGPRSLTIELDRGAQRQYRTLRLPIEVIA